MGAPTCRHRLEIAPRPEHRDPRGEAVAAWAARELGLAGLVVRTRDVYRVDADLDEAEARRVLAELVDPVTQAGALGRLELGDGPYDVVVTVGAKPGVTDPIGRSAKVAVEDTLGRGLPPEAEVFSSVLYCFRGARLEDAERIALGRLANPVVQSVKLETWAEFEAAPPDLSVPRVEAHAAPHVDRVSLPDDDAALLELSRPASPTRAHPPGARPAATGLRLRPLIAAAVRGARARAPLRPQLGAARAQAHASRRNDPDGSPRAPA